MNRIISEELMNQLADALEHSPAYVERGLAHQLRNAPIATLRQPFVTVGEVLIADGAEFFPYVDDLTEMVDHWKENTDLDTHDLVEGILGYFGIGRVRMGRDAAIDELVATLDAWDGAWRSKISTKLFDSLVAMLQRLPDLPDNGSPFELHDRGSKFLCRVCGTEYWAHQPATCPRCRSLKRQVEALRTQPQAPVVEVSEAWDYMKDRISAILRGVPVRDLDEAMSRMDTLIQSKGVR